MGYFANLYTVEADATDVTVRTQTMIYRSDIGSFAYFCWGPGERPPGLYPYAGGTVLCDVELRLLPGYPMVETLGANSDRGLIEANFRPLNDEDPVLFHFVLPTRFIPRRDMKPLEQPIRPFIYSSGERIIVTYPVVGQTTIRYWITRLKDDESIADYEQEKLLHPDEERPSKVAFEINLGILKVKLG
jgi:hypothetical protein